MRIGRYQKIFGVGPLGFLSSFVLLGLFWFLDRSCGHVEITKAAWVAKTAGIIFVILWMGWHIWCLKTLRAWLNRDQLCTTGPYRFVRHPLYSGGIFWFGAGVALWLNSWIILLWPFFSYPLWSLLVRKEEKMMAAVFGETYQNYACRTGRLFPRLFS